MITVREYKSPCGTLILGAVGDSVCLCDWDNAKHKRAVEERIKRLTRQQFNEGNSDVLDVAINQLDEYFAGTRRDFDVDLLMIGTDFQKTVWDAIMQIPYGRTMSYGELATVMGCANSVRAVANAVGANGISIFVPCHRVIGTSGSLTGYAGGVSAKQKLLELERI